MNETETTAATPDKRSTASAEAFNAKRDQEEEARREYARRYYQEKTKPKRRALAAEASDVA